MRESKNVMPSSRAQPQPAGGLSGTAKWRLFAGIILVAAVIVLGRAFPVGEWLQTFNRWVADLAAPGMLVFVAVYVVAAVLFIPGSVLTLGAGFAFGVAKGFVAASIGSTLGAAAAFLVARYLARDAVSRKFSASARFTAVDRAVGREGGKIVLLLRLSPVFPFNALNYLLGLTAVRFWSYVIASWVGMAPGALLYVYLGHAGRLGLTAAAGGADGGDAVRYVYLGIGFLATLVVTIFVTRLARRALQQAGRDGGGLAR